MNLSNLPIGIFDSGVGGLTVLNSIQRVMPNEQLLYLGEPARVPYGTKSSESVVKYASQAAKILVDRGIKLLVVACNTASSVALGSLRAEFDFIPIMGVVEPGAAASCKVTKNGRIAVIGTEGTVNGNAYQDAIVNIRPDAIVSAKACSLFVALAEEGLVDGPIAEAVIDHYLSSLLSDQLIDCLVLGCTHFPVLANAIKNVVGDKVSLVDSADTTAMEVHSVLESNGLRNSSVSYSAPQFLVTDGPDRFARVAKIFCNNDASKMNIQLIDIN